MPLRTSIATAEVRLGAASQAVRLIELYGAYVAIIYSRRCYMLREAAADDVTQETFLRVHRHVGAIPDGDAVLPWLFSRTPLAAHGVLAALDHLVARGGEAVRASERPGVAADEPLSELLEKAER
jgi:DNA-directed RNA polymerase specialized sigma24 family protein